MYSMRIARICSILRKAGEARGMNVESAGIEEIVAELGLDDIDLSPLAHESELALMRKMADFSDLVAGAARDRAPFRLTHYAQELAGLFHSFYGNCHVLGEDGVRREGSALPWLIRLVSFWLCLWIFLEYLLPNECRGLTIYIFFTRRPFGAFLFL